MGHIQSVSCTQSCSGEFGVIHMHASLWHLHCTPLPSVVRASATHCAKVFQWVFDFILTKNPSRKALHSQLSTDKGARWVGDLGSWCGRQHSAHSGCPGLNQPFIDPGLSELRKFLQFLEKSEIIKWLNDRRKTDRLEGKWWQGDRGVSESNHTERSLSAYVQVVRR